MIDENLISFRPRADRTDVRNELHLLEHQLHRSRSHIIRQCIRLGARNLEALITLDHIADNPGVSTGNDPPPVEGSPPGAPSDPDGALQPDHQT